MSKLVKSFDLNNNSRYILVRDLADKYISQGLTTTQLWKNIEQSLEFFSQVACFLAISKLQLKRVTW